MQCTIQTKCANEDSGQKSAKNVNSLLETSFYYTFQYWVLGTLKNYFSGILHSFFKISLFFSFHKLKLDDFTNSRANKRHFENFEQILSTVTLT